MNLTNNYRNLAGAVILQAIRDRDFNFFESIMFDFYKDFLSYGNLIKKYFRSEKTKNFFSAQEKQKIEGFITISKISKKFDKSTLEIRGICNKLKIDIIPIICQNGKTQFFIRDNDFMTFVKYLIAGSKK